MDIFAPKTGFCLAWKIHETFADSDFVSDKAEKVQKYRVIITLCSNENKSSWTPRSGIKINET